MSQFSTLNFLINSYYAGMKESNFLSEPETVFDDIMNGDEVGFEPSETCLEAVMSFALQYDVVKTESAGAIELNLN